MFSLPEKYYWDLQGAAFFVDMTCITQWTFYCPYIDRFLMTDFCCSENYIESAVSN